MEYYIFPPAFTHIILSFSLLCFIHCRKMAPSAPVLLSVSLLFLTSHASPDSSFYLSDIVNHVTKSHHVLNSFLKNPSHLQKWTSLLDSAKGQSIGLFTNLAASDFTTNTDQNISALCIDHIMLTMQSLKTGNAQALQSEYEPH